MSRRPFVTTAFIMLLVAVSLLMLRLLWVFLSAIVLALVLRSLFAPLHWRLRNRLGNHPQLAAGLTTFIVLLVAIIPTAGFVTTLSQEAFEFYERTREAKIVDQVMAYLRSQSGTARQLLEAAERIGITIDRESLNGLYASAGKNIGLLVYERLSGAAQNALLLLFHFGIMLIVLYSLFVDGHRLKAWLMELSPLPAAEEERIAESFRQMSGAVFLGNGTASGLQGICGGLGFYFFDIGAPVLWGAVIAFLAFLPIIGASVVFVPTAIYLAIFVGPGKALGYLLFNAAYVAVLEYGLKPRLIGNRMQAPGVLTFLGIVAGLQLFGILGLVYGPLIVAVFLSLAHIYQHHYEPQLVDADQDLLSSAELRRPVELAVLAKDARRRSENLAEAGDDSPGQNAVE